MRKEAIGGFEHGAIATGFGQCSCRVFGQNLSEFHEALCTPHIAQIGIGKFVHHPVEVIGLATHTRLLGQPVALEATGKVQGPSIPQEPIK